LDGVGGTEDSDGSPGRGSVGRLDVRAGLRLEQASTTSRAALQQRYHLADQLHVNDKDVIVPLRPLKSATINPRTVLTGAYHISWNHHSDTTAHYLKR
jgi:hypothetical protein